MSKDHPLDVVFKTIFSSFNWTDNKDSIESRKDNKEAKTWVKADVTAIVFPDMFVEFRTPVYTYLLSGKDGEYLLKFGSEELEFSGCLNAREGFKHLGLKITSHQEKFPVQSLKVADYCSDEIGFIVLPESVCYIRNEKDNFEILRSFYLLNFFVDMLVVEQRREFYVKFLRTFDKWRISCSSKN